MSFSAYSQNLREHTNTEFGFKISYPKGWKIIKQGRKSPAKFVASVTESGYVPASVILTLGESKHSTIDTVFYHNMKISQTSGDKVIDAGEIIINNQKYYWYSSLIDNNIENIKSITYITVKEDMIYRIRFKANKAHRFPEYEALFFKIINSLKLY